MSSRRTLLCIVPIFSYVTPKGTLNRGKQKGSCARFCILFRSRVRTTIFSAFTVAYGSLIVTSNLLKVNLTIYSTTRKNRPQSSRATRTASVSISSLRDFDDTATPPHLYLSIQIFVPGCHNYEVPVTLDFCRCRLSQQTSCRQTGPIKYACESCMDITRHILCLAPWIFGTHVAIPRFERPCEAR